MKTKLILAMTSALALTACNDDSVTGSTGNAVSYVEISGDPTTGETLTSTISDGNGFDPANVTYTWVADNKVLSGSTSGTYLLTDADVGSMISLIVNYTDNDGYAEKAISAETDVIEIPAVPSAGSVAISGDAYVGFELTAVITDENGSGDTPIVYVWMADGVAIADATSASYTLTEAELTKTITVSATYTDNDDFPEDTLSDPTAPVIVKPADVVTSQVAKITDTMGVGIGDGSTDTGELRFKLSDESIDPLVTGKLSLSFRKEANAVNNNPTDPDTDFKDAYIGIFGTKISTGYELVELRVKEGNYVIRGQEGTVDTDATFTGEEWVDIDITWDATNASASVAPLITLSINGTPVSADPFPTYDSGKTDGSLGTHFETIMNGVQHMTFRLGDNDATVATAFYLDDIKLYSDVAGTAEVFADDFEGFAVDDSLDTDNSASPYNSSTNEAVVAEVAREGGVADDPADPPADPPVDNFQVAKITDTMGVGIGDGSTDTGELRFKLSDESISPLDIGKLSVSFRKEANAVNNNPNDTDTDFKDAYIGIFGSKVSTGYELVELRVKEGNYVIRGQEGTVDTDATFTGDEWVDIDITWDASNASATVAPLITLSINGTPVSADAFPTYDSGKSDGTLGTHFETIMDGVQYLVFRIGDNDATVATAFYIDDIKLYSDLEGTTEVFSDHFESTNYAVGGSLDTDNPASPYNSSTNEAVVADRL
jgi:nitrogen fixation protein FixH